MKCSAFTAEQAFLAKFMRCEVGSTRETPGCVALFVTLGLRPRKANASAKFQALPVCIRKPRSTRKKAPAAQHCQCGYRELREAHDRTTRCYAPVARALARLAFSSLLPVDGCAANSSFIIHHSSFIIHHWLMAPWMLARASAKRIKHCQCILETTGYTFLTT